jgi:hypothetical protein
MTAAMIPSTVMAPPMSTTEAVTAEVYMFYSTVFWGKNPYTVFLTMQQTPRFRCRSLSCGTGGEYVSSVLVVHRRNTANGSVLSVIPNEPTHDPNQDN